MLARQLIKKMKPADRSLVRDGALFTFFGTGLVSYWNYRERIRKDFMRSEAHYRLNRQLQNITPWKSLYWTWYRMPKEEYNVYHRFVPYYIIGQLDYSKEILIPYRLNNEDGYIVVNPLYCYEGGKISWKSLIQKDGKPVVIERAAVIVNRGWIPAHLKDKRRRPEEVNSRQLVKIKGVFRPGKDIHDYKIPNNPDNNEWHNLSLEDIGLYWDLPNYDEQKYYYFQAMDLKDNVNDFVLRQNQSGVHTFTKDETIDDYYGWRWSETTHNLLEKTFGLAAAGAFTFFWWA